MPNVSPSSPRTPGRVPRRGLAALVLTATATALLFSFKTPADMFASGPLDSFTAAVMPATDEPRTTTTSGLGSGLTASSMAAATPQAQGQPTASPATTEPPSTAPPSEPPPSEPPATEPPASLVVPGQTVRTPYGSVQVEVTIGPDGITDVQALQLPYDRSYSARISQVVEPMLRDEALQAQSADINLISGATYTSKGYAMSLQSALDQAVASVNAPA